MGNDYGSIRTMYEDDGRRGEPMGILKCTKRPYRSAEVGGAEVPPSHMCRDMEKDYDKMHHCRPETFRNSWPLIEHSYIEYLSEINEVAESKTGNRIG